MPDAAIEDGSTTVAEGKKKGIATAVYDCIARDMERAGALLWPAGPTKMTDAEFKVWWRRSPALVFYYPHRERLGFEPRHEFEALLNDGRAGKGTSKTASRASAASRLWNKFGSVRRWFASKVFRPKN